MIIPLLLSVLASWRGGVIRADLDAASGQEYIQVDETGTIRELTAGRQRSIVSNSFVIGQFSLAQQERVVQGPAFIPGTLKNTIWILTDRNGTRALRGIPFTGVIASAPITAQTGYLFPVIWGSAANKVAVINTVAATVDTGAMNGFGVAGWGSGTSAPSGAASLASSGDSLFVLTTDGSLWKSLKGSAWTKIGNGAGVNLNATTLSREANLVAGLDGAGTLRWIHGGTWKQTTLEEPIEEVASGLESGKPIVRIRLASGRIADVDPVTGNVSWILKNSFQQLGFVKNANGSTDLSEGGASPAGSGLFSELFSRLWGLFHHGTVVSVSELQVSPAPYSQRLGSLLVRLQYTGSSSAFWNVDLVADSSASLDPLVVLQSSQRLLDGLNDIVWNGGSIASGRYVIRAKVKTATDSVFLWKRILLDRDTVTGKPSLTSTGSVQSGNLTVGTSAKLTISSGTLADVPTGISGLRGEIRLSNEGFQDVRPWSPSASVSLDGKDQAGIALPTGDYDLLVKVVDSAGNISSFQGPWSVVNSANGQSNSVNKIRIRPLSAQISGLASPIPVTSKVGYQTSLVVRLVHPGSAGTMHLRVPDGTELVCGDWSVSGNLISGNSDTTVSLNCRVAPGAKGWISGRNLLRATFMSSSGDSVATDIPVFLDSVKTWISAPGEGSSAKGVVEVRGVATAPNMDGDFSRYRVWSAKGHIVPPTTARTLDQLFGSVDWKPVTVPLSSQLVRSENGYIPSRFDGAWPNSNVGVQSVSSEGSLGYFGPLKDTGEYTVLVATESGSALASWDCKHFRYQSGSLVDRGVVIVDSVRFRHPGSGLGVVDRSDTISWNDTLLWSIRAKVGWGQAIATLYKVGSDSAPDGGQILSIRRFSVDSVARRYVQTGFSDFGGTLDSGMYAWRISLPGDAIYSAWDTTLKFDVHPERETASSILRVLPDTVQRIPGEGNAPKINVSVALTSTSLYRIVLNDHFGRQVGIVADSVSGSTGTWDVAVDTVTAGSYSVVLSSYQYSGPQVVASAPLVIQDAGYLLDTTVGFIEAPIGDSIWAPTPTSMFKFRAKAFGDLNWYPKRLVNYQTAAYGVQTVRNFLDVPWGLDYIKFYNSAEIFSRANWEMRSYYCPWIGTCRHKETYSQGDQAQQTLWAPRWDDRWKLKRFGSIDSAMVQFAQDPDTGAQHARTFLRTGYFGDAPWIPLDVGAADEITDDAGARKVRNRQDAIFKNCADNDLEECGALDFSKFPEDDELAKAGGHKCSFLNTINLYKESPNTHCKIIGRTREEHNPGDRWKGINTGDAYIAFAIPSTVVPGALEMGVKFYEATGVSDDSRNPRAQTSSNLLVQGFRTEDGWAEGNNDDKKRPRIWWTKRCASMHGSHTSYRLWDDNWEDGDDGQSTFMALPDVDWNSPELLMHGRIIQPLNEARLRKGQREFADGYGWKVQKGGDFPANCWARSSDGIDTCVTGASGHKSGLRGFGFQPNLPNLRTISGLVVPPYRYITNYFDTTMDSGMVAWAKGAKDPDNFDELVFRPHLNLSDDMMNVTWDTLGIPYPLGAWPDSSSATVESDSTGRIFAHVATPGVSSQGFLEDSANFIHFAPRVFRSDSLDLDSVDLPLLPSYNALLSLTDSGQPNKTKYGFIYRNSLKWQVSLRSWPVMPDGTPGMLEVDSLYHRSQVIDIPGKPLVARVYYRNRPVHLGSWNSELDTLFREQKGWMYGSGTFNDSRFLGRNPGLPGGFTSMFNPLRFDTATPSSVSPFVRQGAKLVFNPSLDTSSIHWSLEVYYPDGSTPNVDLGTAGQAPKQNFQLQLDANSGTRSWLPLRGRVPTSVVYRGRTLRFTQYSIMIRSKNDTARWEGLPVNRFYTPDSVGGQVGTHAPAIGADPWETDTLKAPVLSWWDVTSRIGDYEVMVLSTYKRVGDDSAFALVQKKTLHLGSVISGEAPTVISAPYQRANLTMPVGADTAGARVRLDVLSPGQVDFPANAPKVAPVGPVIKIQSTGKKQFSGDTLPLLQFNLSAREIFQFEGRTDFDAASPSAIQSILRSVGSTYRINVLGEDGNLNTLPTDAAYQFENGDPNDRELYTITLTAKVPHFSWIFIQADDGKAGARPIFTRVSSVASGVVIEGISEQGAKAGSVLYSSRPIPTDLVVSWTSDTGSKAKVITGLPSMSLSVEIDGTFRDTIAWADLPLGASTLLLHYVSSRTADASVVLRASDTLHIWDFEASPLRIDPQCGASVHVATFQADRPGEVVRVLRDSTGRILRAQSFHFAIGANRLAWDGCIDGGILLKGAYHLDYRFQQDSSWNRSSVVALGVVPDAIVDLSVSPDRFVPSVTNPNHGAHIAVTLSARTSKVIHLRAVGLSNKTSVALADLAGSDSVRTFVWSGRNFQGPLVGSWNIQAWLGSDSSVRFDHRVEVVDQPGIVGDLTSDRDSLDGAVNLAKLSFEVSSPVVAKVWLVPSDSVTTVLWPMGQTRVDGSATWTWSAAASRLPTMAIASWISADSLHSGIDTVRFARKRAPNPIDSLIVDPVTDTIWQNLTPSLGSALHGSRPSSVRVILHATKSTTVIFTLTDSKSRIARRDTISLAGGAATLEWLGSGSRDSVLKAGSYRYHLVLLDTSVANPTLVDRTFRLQPLPDLVVVRDPSGVADRIAATVRGLGDLSVEVWSDTAAAAYMEAKPLGAVGLLHGGFDTLLLMSNPWNPVYRFVRGGGRIGFLGGIPGLDSIRYAKDSTTSVLASLLGFASPYATSDEYRSASHRLVRMRTASTWMDSTLGSDLSLVKGRGDTLHGFGIHDSSVVGLPGIWLSLAGFDSALASGENAKHDRWSSSFFTRPQLWHSNQDSLGAMLVVHPYALRQAVDSVKAQTDFAKLLFRFFFSNDVSMDAANVKLRSQTIRPGDELVLDFAPRFTGDLVLDSVVVHVTDPAGMDTSRIFHDVSAANIAPVTFRWPRLVSWPLGDQTMTISATAFTQVRAPGDTVYELNLSNNAIVLPWTNADTARPWIRLDSVVNGVFVRKWSTLPAAGSFIAHARAGSARKYGALSYTWKILRPDGSAAAAWSGSSFVSDTVRLDQEMMLAQDLSSDTSLQIRLLVRDVFGNSDSVQARVSIDTAAPRLVQWTVLHGAGSQDVTDPKIRTFNRLGMARDTLVASATDERGVVSWAILKTTQSTLVDTFATGTSPAMVAIDRAGENGTIWTFRACDQAGNCSQSDLQVFRESHPPHVNVWRTTKTLLDSLRKDTGISVTTLGRRNLLNLTTGAGLIDGADVIDPLFSQLLALDSAKSWERSIETHRGDVFNLILEGKAMSSIKMQVQLDGVDLTNTAMNPYLRADGDSLLPARFRNEIANHTYERFVQIPITGPRHILRVTVRDSSDSVSQGTIYLESVDADRQITDPVGDGQGSADWGEIYARRSQLVVPGYTDPQSWNFWLLHRRNPLVSGEVDQQAYQLLVDLDNDSTTGDFLPKGLGGADVAVEWGPQGASDAGTSVSYSLWTWNPSSKSWGKTASSQTEGWNWAAGFALATNHADDPATVSVGTGDQRLPSGAIAYASNGATEIGIRTGDIGSLRPLRWAILPVNAPGDTVKDSTGGMLTFTPTAFRSIVVDGVTSDWWPDPTALNIEMRSQTVAYQDSTWVGLRIRNLGTRPLSAFGLKYWVKADSMPRVALLDVPAGWPLHLGQIRRESAKGDGIWSIELQCGGCQAVGGDNIGLGRLVLLGPSRLIPEDDWSQSIDSTKANGRFTIYGIDGSMVWGNEPDAQTILPVVARIQPSVPMWTKIGHPLVLSAGMSYDPEGHELSCSWWNEGLGTTVRSLLDTVQYDRPGKYKVTLKVSDPTNSDRFAMASTDIYVTDGSGGIGQAPVRQDSLVIFDDQWERRWNQHWAIDMRIRSSDSVVGIDGTRHLRNPAQGAKLLSLPFDSSSGVSIVATCDSAYWQAHGTPGCNDAVDLSKYTNLEFKFATDAGVRRPLRIWMTWVTHGEGNGVSEEDFAYVQSYLPDPTSPDQWQQVSIPLPQVLTETSSRSDYLQLKLMPDDSWQWSGGFGRVLIDDMKLIRYATAPEEQVTTRKTGIQVLVRTNDPSFSRTQLAMPVRLLNSGGVALSLDSLRVRLHYHSVAGQVHGDTTWGADTAIYASGNGLPLDSTIDPVSFRTVVVGLGEELNPVPKSNAYYQVTWMSFPGLSLRTTASATFWGQIGNYKTTVNGERYLGNVLQRFDGGHSIHWSWPDSADIWQFAPHVVVDAKKPDGSYGRIWGYAPGEDPATVSFWKREVLRDPSESRSAGELIKAKIVNVGSTHSPGAQLLLSADSSFDPLGNPLGFHWVDRTGAVISQGRTYSTILPTTGSFQIWLQVFDLFDPARSSADSLNLEVHDVNRPVDSQTVLDRRLGTWTFGESWGGDAPGTETIWTDSVVVPAKDGACQAILRAPRGDSIVVVPFGGAVQGVRFQTPSTELDLSRMTHLEFWVASAREWPNDPDRERPIRIWLTHQVAPRYGDDNRSSEEDFNIVQLYLPKGGLTRSWHKVVIPLDELIQTASPESSDSTKWFLKFMRDMAGSDADTSRDADLYLSGIRFTRYASADVNRVTTRRAGALVMGELNGAQSLGVWDGTIRLLNPTSRSLYSDSIRIRMPTWCPSGRQWWFGQNTANMGTDESVDPAWFSPVKSDSLWPASIQDSRSISNGDLRMNWTSHLSLRPGKGLQGLFHAQSWPWSDTLHRPRPLSTLSQTMNQTLLRNVLVEQRLANGSWVRLWGLAPGETWATAQFSARDSVVPPEDTIAGPESVRTIQCSDTIIVPIPPDTGTNNQQTTPGRVADLPSMGRITGLTTESITIAGRPGVLVTQNASDWSVSHRFTFDTAWARRSRVLVDVYVDPSQVISASWIGSLSASTFDHSTWIALNPQNGIDLNAAVGTWKTIAFDYDPARYVIGRQFDFQLLANGHAGSTSNFQFVIGQIRLADPTIFVPPPAYRTIGMDTVSVWSTCNSCQVLASPGRTYIAFAPLNGSPSLERTIPVDTSFHASSYFGVDLQSDFTIDDWATLTMILVDGASGRYWDAFTISIPKGISAGWTHVLIPFDGRLYDVGTSTTVKFVMNAGAPVGKRIMIDNFTWNP